MSYSIIFETKIVKLSDGRIIHFDRSGCNNDNAGRHKDEFSATIYTIDEFVQKAENFKKNSKPYKEADYMELKIGSRNATFFDYGEHLLRMLKRAKTYTEFIKSFYFGIKHITGIHFYEPEDRIVSVKEFSDIYDKLFHNSQKISYSRIIEYPDIKDEENLINLIESGESLQFTIR